MDIPVPESQLHPPREPSGDVHLAHRDIDILPLLARGLTDKEIGAALGLSQATISTYVRNLLAKAGSANRTALITRAFMDGVLIAGSDGSIPEWSGASHLHRTQH